MIVVYRARKSCVSCPKKTNTTLGGGGGGGGGRFIQSYTRHTETRADVYANKS